MKRVGKSIVVVFMVLTAMVSSCTNNSQKSTVNQLTGKSWELTRLNSGDLEMSKYPSGVPSITFDPGGGISGTTGCNSYSGEYVLNGDSISLDPGSMTKMACDGSGEIDFIFAVEEVNNLKISATELILLNGSKEVLSFSAK